MGSRPQCCCAAGFTIVELVTVIVLLGILSVAAVSRMVSPSDFAPGMVSSAASEQFRLARALAMSREDTSVSLELRAVGSDWQLRTLTVADGEVRQELVERGTTTVVVDNGAFSGAVNTTATLTLQFDSGGSLVAATLGATVLDPLLAIRFTIAGASQRMLCAYPSGYLLSGDCV